MNFLPKQLSSSWMLIMLAVMTAIATSCNKTALTTPDDSSGDKLVFAKTNSAVSAPVQTARSGVVVSAHIHGFYEYLPKGYSNSAGVKYPLLICMHGLGQVGNGTTDLPGLLLYGPAMMINNGTFPTSFTVDGKTYSMIIITPQLTDAGMFPVDMDSLIEYCKKNYQVDTSRVYLAGLSMGGANVWHYAGFSPATASKITAMVPICAWTTPDNNYQITPQEAQNVAQANIKIWQTHCYSDPTAMFSWSVSQGDLVMGNFPAPNPAPKLTCFNSNSHDAWTTTYDPAYKESGMNIYQWMLHYTKGSPSSPITPRVPATQVVTLKGSNNLYLHNNGDGSPLFLNSSTFTLWEGFVVVPVSGSSKIALQNQGQYITRINPASVSCTANSITSAETFLWIYNSDGTVSFKSNNKYLSNNAGLVTCLSASIGPNEKFRVNQ